LRKKCNKKLGQVCETFNVSCTCPNFLLFLLALFFIQPATTFSSPLKKIVIDAGHGGKDSGAFSRSGTKEKNINLYIALELAKALERQGKYDILLTRKDDRFIPLHDRSHFANEMGADLFVSIHCNAARRRGEGGFEIYFLSEKATDHLAEDTADFENAVHAFEEGNPHEKEKLMGLLSSMARNAYMNESSLLCHAINETVQRELSMRSRGVKQANFHVLHGVQMPSVLVETAFITNRVDEKKLRSKKFRSGMVKAIIQGIENYENRLVLLQTAP